jgi:hypothetical protein
MNVPRSEPVASTSVAIKKSVQRKAGSPSATAVSKSVARKNIDAQPSNEQVTSQKAWETYRQIAPSSSSLSRQLGAIGCQCLGSPACLSTLPPDPNCGPRAESKVGSACSRLRSRLRGWKHLVPLWGNNTFANSYLVRGCRPGTRH